ncbi:MAG: hypothetical protein R2792_15010 [Saprospiraceae bacterium]
MPELPVPDCLAFQNIQTDFKIRISMFSACFIGDGIIPAVSRPRQQVVEGFGTGLQGLVDLPLT